MVRHYRLYLMKDRKVDSYLRNIDSTPYTLHLRSQRIRRPNRTRMAILQGRRFLLYHMSERKSVLHRSRTNNTAQRMSGVRSRLSHQ